MYTDLIMPQSIWLIFLYTIVQVHCATSITPEVEEGTRPVSGTQVENGMIGQTAKPTDTPVRTNPVPDSNLGARQQQNRAEAKCQGEFAYLHGDLWPLWYNMRVACDPEHKAWWRCERVRSGGTGNCDEIKERYEHCVSTWDLCAAGIYAPTDQTGCWTCPNKWPAERCDTRSFDYEELWGSYYGVQWAAHTNWHRHLTIHVKNTSGELLAAFSSCPNGDGCGMDGLDNFGIGPIPQGFIQLTPEDEKFTASFGAFACIRLPGNTALVLRAEWMNDFPHTCKEEYQGQPRAPCWTEDIIRTFEKGRHYLWNESGIELMDTCTGPPDRIGLNLPLAVCDTSIR